MKTDIKNRINNLFKPFDNQNIPGIAVGIKSGDEIIYNQGFGQANLEHPSPINQTTVFDIGSMAKQFIGISIALLEESNLISTDDIIQTYLPDFPFRDSRIKISDLLFHSSGIRNYTVLAYYMMGVHESDAISTEELYNLLLRIKSLNFYPGEKYEYSDSNYFLLAKIVEVISGKSINSFANETIFKPLGMEDTLFREVHSQIIPGRALSYIPYPVAFRKSGDYRHSIQENGAFYSLNSNYEHMGAEGVFSSVRDLIKWIKNFSDNRLGKQKHALIEKILTPGIQINHSVGYGYGINIGSFENLKFFGHNGAIHGYTSSMGVFPDENLSIICLSNQNQKPAWLFRKPILEILYPDNFSGKSTIRQKQTEMSNFPEGNPGICGKYQDPETASILEIITEDNQYYFVINEGDKHQIKFISSDIYSTVSDELKIKIEIEREGDNKILALSSSENNNKIRYLPFLQNSNQSKDLSDYEGNYFSDELLATFQVIPNSEGLQLQNENRHFCSMDLFYRQTIKDNFIAYDPHPYCSQISFVREKGEITAMVYRDYDGDGRENIIFKKTGI